MAQRTLAIAMYVATATALFWTIFGCPTSPSSFKNSTVSVSSDKSSHFVLQTQVKDGKDTKFDGLYVFAYHTGAGLNDAMLRTEFQKATPATAFAGSSGSGSMLSSQYFAVLFQIGGSPYELMPTPATGYGTPDDELQPVRINVNGAPPSVDSAFYFEGNKLRWTSSADSIPPGGFDGWLACESDHAAIGDPNVKSVQLFYRAVSGTAPVSCADVDLVAIY
ncbi:MAG: hypothetical protein SEPTF4163_000729 [Sporothrix epigloea]